MDLILSLDYNLYGAFQVAGAVGHVGYPVFWAPEEICFRVQYLAQVPLVGTKWHHVPRILDSVSPYREVNSARGVGAEFLVCSSILYHGPLCCA